MALPARQPLPLLPFDETALATAELVVLALAAKAERLEWPDGAEEYRKTAVQLRSIRAAPTTRR